MSKIFTTLLLLAVFTLNAIAQSTNVIYFQGDNGASPTGSLLWSGNTLYGMTSAGGTMSGGSRGGGEVFSVNTDGSGFKKLVLFKSPADSDNFRFPNPAIFAPGGYHPLGTLTLAGNTLYGMTSMGGPNSGGNIFSLNLDGSNYKDLYDFNGANGSYPNGSLIYADSLLYGMTAHGGTASLGCIFSIKKDGTFYKKLYDFTALSGSGPQGDLILLGDTLYGMTFDGGANNKGTIFAINKNGTGYKILFNFDGPSGANPTGTLILLPGILLYGITQSGGDNNSGTLFSINKNGTAFKKLYSFLNTNNGPPSGSLLYADKTLYGSGFSIQVNGSGYRTLQLNAVNSLIMDQNHILYGMTNSSLFKYKDIPSINICMVTVDDDSKYNRVVWEKPASTLIDSFIVLRETSTNLYKPIGAVPYSGLSEFTDTVRTKYFPFSGNPNAGTYRYKMQVKDIHGNLSPMSSFQNTMFVTQSGGNFNWNLYLIEGMQGAAASSYILSRDDNGTGNYHAIVGVSGSQTTATDPDFKLYPNGRWRIEVAASTACNSSYKTDNTYNTIKSNAKNAAVTGILNLNGPSNIAIYPNPTNGIFTIEHAENSSEFSYSIKDIFGKEVYRSSASDGNQIDLGTNAKGVYFIDVHVGKQRFTSKLFIQ